MFLLWPKRKPHFTKIKNTKHCCSNENHWILWHHFLMWLYCTSLKIKYKSVATNVLKFVTEGLGCPDLHKMSFKYKFYLAYYIYELQSSQSLLYHYCTRAFKNFFRSSASYPGGSVSELKCYMVVAIEWLTAWIL